MQRLLLKSLHRFWYDAAVMDLSAFADQSGEAERPAVKCSGFREQLCSW